MPPKKAKKTSSSTTKEESLSWGDLAKKVVYTSLGSATMARDMLKEGNLSKELLTGILSKAEKRKEDIMEILAREVSKFLGKINVSEEISKALEGLVINFNASVDFKKKTDSKGLKPKTTIHQAEVKKRS